MQDKEKSDVYYQSVAVQLICGSGINPKAAKVASMHYRKLLRGKKTDARAQQILKEMRDRQALKEAKIIQDGRRSESSN